jgi:hypothetical protein
MIFHDPEATMVFYFMVDELEVDFSVAFGQACGVVGW